MNQPKKKPSQLQNDTFFEQLKDLPSQTTRTIKKELIQEGGKTAWNQFWGVEAGSSSFEKETPPEQIERKEKDKKRGAYEQRQEVVLFNQKERETAQEIEQIRQELLAIVKTVSQIDFEVEKAVREIPTKPGVYHIRFLQRISRLLRLIREQLADSRTWLKLSTSKRKQRGYWSMYKKRGTTFGLSGERVVSTQTG